MKRSVKVLLALGSSSRLYPYLGPEWLLIVVAALILTDFRALAWLASFEMFQRNRHL